MRSTLIRLVLSAAASLTLYLTFFGFVEEISQVVTSRTIVSALAVLALAMVFSLVHSVFAHHLLRALGLDGAQE